MPAHNDPTLIVSQFNSDFTSPENFSGLVESDQDIMMPQVSHYSLYPNGDLDNHLLCKHQEASMPRLYLSDNHMLYHQHLLSKARRYDIESRKDGTLGPVDGANQILRREYPLFRHQDHGERQSYTLSLPSSSSHSVIPTLQCQVMGCPHSFPSLDIWRQHNMTCVQEKEECDSFLQCAFLPCGRLFKSAWSLIQHYHQMHLVYACTFENCRIGFETNDLAQAHISMHNKNHGEAAVVSLLSPQPKEWTFEELRNGKHFDDETLIPLDQILIKQLTRSHESQEELEVDLDTNNLLQVDAQALRAQTTVPSIDEPRHFIPRTFPGKDFGQDLCGQRDSEDVSNHYNDSLLRVQTPPRLTRCESVATDNSPSWTSSSSPSPLSRAEPYHHTSPPHSTQRIRTSPQVWPRLLVRQLQQEPAVITSLTIQEQRKHLNSILTICITAAYAFYVNNSLRNALDKKGVPIFLTKDKQLVNLPFDLTLPQWTQHLRKACDTKHIDHGMVSCLESFKGEIQPVDEVRHAVTKEKLKSDRALLALIESARVFTKQLKDWDRCDMIDNVYSDVETAIHKKRQFVSSFMRPV